MEWESEIERAAGEEGLPPGLVRAIVLAESAGDPWAMRFEPGFYDTYIKGKFFKIYGFTSKPTEYIGLATSWGLMQIMGATARERGFALPFFTELCRPDVGLRFGCLHLKWLEMRYRETYGWPGVVAAYNAGSPRRGPDGDWVNRAYVGRVLSTAGELV